MKYFIKSIENGKHYKKKDLEFDYLKLKDFKELENPVVLGAIKINKEIKKTKKDVVVIQSNDLDFTYLLDKNYDYNEDNNKYLVGFVLISNNTYVAVFKPISPLWVLIPLGLIFLFIGCVFLYKDIMNNDVEGESIQNQLEIEDAGEWDGNMPQNGQSSGANAETIEIPGYADIHLSKNNPNVVLVNPDGNTVYFVYTIMDGDKVLHETKAIEPNKAVEINLRDLLELGEHQLVFSISCYDINTQEGCNGANQQVKVTVDN